MERLVYFQGILSRQGELAVNVQDDQNANGVLFGGEGVSMWCANPFSELPFKAEGNGHKTMVTSFCFGLRNRAKQLRSLLNPVALES